MYEWLLKIKALLSEAEKEHQVTDLVETMGLGRTGLTRDPKTLMDYHYK